MQANQFYNASAADQATNNLVDEGTTLLHGDPNKVNPDGTHDTGFFGKQGQDMMDAAAATRQQLQDLVKNHRENLPSGQAQLEYDRNSRRWLQIQEGEMGRAYDGAQKTWMINNNTVSGKQALDDISRSATDDKAFSGYLENLKTAYGKTAQVHGLGDAGSQEAVRNATMDGWKVRLESLAATDPSRAEQLAVENKALLGVEGPALVTKYKKAAETADVHAGVGEAVAANIGKSTSELAGSVPGAAPRGGYGPEFTQYNQHLNNGDVQSALRLSEGLRTNAYWDVNHWRTGYGSDTVTRADGTVENVTAMTRITPEDAERDLQRRTALAAQTAQGAIGDARWGAMTPGAKAAMTSVVYNYGHVPSDIAAAARSGDPQALAGAITNHANDNAGVNFQRRRAEAGAVLGLGGNFGPGGPNAQPASLQIGGQAPPPALTSGGPSTLEGAPAGIQPATYMPAAEAAKPLDAPPEPETPEEKLERLTLAKDATLAYALEHHPEWNDAQQREAARQIELEFTRFTIATQMDAHTRKVRKDALGDKVAGMMLNGQPDQAFAMVHDPKNGLTNTERLAMSNAIEKQVGKSDPATLGPAYGDFLKRALAPPGSEDRIGIGDADKIFQGVGQGLTMRGAKEILSTVGSIQKSVDEFGNQIMIHTALERARDKIFHEEDIGSYHTRPPQAAVNAREAFTNKFLSDYNKYREKGYDPKGFSLFNPEEADKEIEAIYPLRQRRMDQMRAAGEAPEEKPVPAAQSGVDPVAWKGLMASPPIIENGTKIMDPQLWAGALNKLLSNPSPRNMAFFDKSTGAAKGGHWDAADIVEGLTGVRPANQEGSGAPTPIPAHRAPSLMDRAGNALSTAASHFHAPRLPDLSGVGARPLPPTWVPPAGGQ